MHVILRPSSHPQIDPIVATGALFAIGRTESPFNSLDPALVAKLSRRHARLFEEGGSVYLADLGSLNGTSCNGEPVKHVPVALRTGDVVEFGGLVFDVEVQEDDVAEAPVPAAPVRRLVLTPEQFTDTLEPIVVSSFPFLLDKNAEPFVRYKQDLRDVLAYMSRHHAHIFLRDGELFIEDLGSTNGTFVSGRKLDERARQLKDGDTIALGSDRLTYSVRLLRELDEGSTQTPSGIEAVDNPTRTIFVDSATSFLDVYFVAGASGDAEAEPSSRNGAEADSGDDARRRGWPVLVEIRRTLVDGPLLGPMARRVLAGGLIVAVAGGGVWYWHGRELRAIEGAIAREDYRTAVTLATRQLEADPDDPTLRNLATRSAVLHWVPEWVRRVGQGEFDGAAAVTREAAAAVPGDLDAARIMQLLDWATRTRELTAGEPVEEDINRQMIRARGVSELLDWWQADSWTHARTLDRITQLLPEFRDAREQIYRDVRQLRSEGLDYRPLIDLERRLEQAFAANDLARVRRLVGEFVEDHPRFAGRAVLAEDVARLERLQAHVDARRWLEAVRQLDEEPFATEPFRARGRTIAERMLPDEEARAQLAAAADDWRAGRLEEAVAALEQLEAGRWPGFGRQHLERYRTLLRDYRALEAAREQPGYAPALFDFYGHLNESEDAFLLAALEQEFRNHADGALRQAATYFERAQAAWAAYRQSGGIQPEHRLQEPVAPEFTALARRLAEAVDALGRTRRIHRQVDRPLSPEASALAAELAREVAFQRGQVANLAFHDPEVRRRMLALLPEAD